MSHIARPFDASEKVDHLDSSDAGEPYGLWRAWYALFVIEIQGLASGIDIAIVTLLVRPIEAALHINDVGFATVTTTSLAIGLVVLQYPAGLFADIFRRRDVLIVGSAIWTLAALVAARTNSGTIFFFARLIAGIGLSVSAPAVFSLLSDAFPRARRPLAMSIYWSGSSVGAGIGLAMCGYLVAATQRIGTLHIGGMLLSPWQECFVGVAVMGLILVALILTVREPPRMDRATHANVNLMLNLRIFGQYMRRHWLLWTLIFTGACIGTTSWSATTIWAPAFGMRQYGVSGVSSITLLGLFTAGGSLFGAILGGIIVRPSMEKGKARLLPLMMLLVTAVSCIFAVGFPYAPSWLLAVVGIAGLNAANMALNVLFLISIQEAAANEVRGQLFGMFFIIANLPMVMGASLVAYLASGIFAKTGGLVPALAVVGGVTTVVGVLLFAFAGGPYERAKNELRLVDSPPT